MTDQPFAYSLAPADTGWRWNIFDIDGETVASGIDASQSDAQATVEATIRRVASEMTL